MTEKRNDTSDTGSHDDEVVSIIDLIRHGHCDDGSIYRGITNSSLSERGSDEMRRLINQIVEHANWQTIISSPLQRCLHSAHYAHQQFSIPIDTIEGFKEINFGDWEGRSYEEIWQRYGKSVKQYYENPQSYTPPQAENIESFAQRVVLAWKLILQKHRGKHVLAIMHAGVIRILIAHILNMPLRSIFSVNVPYASFSRIRVFHRCNSIHATLDFHNASSILEMKP